MTADMPLEARVEAAARAMWGGLDVDPVRWEHNAAEDTKADNRRDATVALTAAGVPGLLAERDMWKDAVYQRDVKIDQMHERFVEMRDDLRTQLAEARAALDGEGERIASAKLDAWAEGKLAAQQATLEGRVLVWADNPYLARTTKPGDTHA